MSEALRAFNDRDTLFRSLARELRPAVRFSVLGIGLYYEDTQAVEPYVLEDTGESGPPPEMSVE